MKLTTYNSTSVYLIVTPHDWTHAVQLEAHYASAVARTLTGLEMRRPLALHWRLAQTSVHVIADAAVPKFRSALAARRKEPILMPCFALGADYADGLDPNLDAPLQLVIEADGSQWEIIESGNAPGFVPGEFAKIYPLLWGDFVEEPDPVAEGGRLSKVQMRFVETGSAEYALSWTNALAPSLNLATRSAHAWPIRSDWSKVPRSGKASVDVFEEPFKTQRGTHKTIYDQLAVREFDMGFTLFDDDISEAFAFVQAMQGAVHSFWLPTFVDEGDVEVVAGADVTLDDASVIPVYIAIYDRDSIYHRKVLSVAANTITLNADLPGLNFDEATLCALRMCRLLSPTIKLSFETETSASCSLRFVETPNEIELPADEIYGTTSGGLDFEAHLFEWTVDALGNVRQWHTTDAPEALNWNGSDWLPDLIEVKGIAQDDSLDVDDVQLTGRVVDGHPFALFVPFKLESPLQLTIYRVTLDATGAIVGVPTALTRGEVAINKMRGEVVEAELRPHRRLLDRRGVSWLIQPECNYAAFSAPCGLQRAAWEFTGELVEYIGGSAVKLRLQNVARVGGAPLPSVPVGYFTSGWIQVGAGDSFNWRAIVECVNVEGAIGDVDVTIQWPLNGVYSTGQTFTLYPGCSGAAAVCKSKFGNFSNYGGCPHVPESNPALRSVERSPTKTSGGKK